MIIILKIMEFIYCILEEKIINTEFFQKWKIKEIKSA